MAEPGESTVSSEAFRSKKAPSCKMAGTDSSSLSKITCSSSTQQSGENVSARDVGIDQRQEKVRLLRERQVDERKKKNEGRRVAFEERKRQKELDEKAKWEAMKEQALKQGNNSSSKTGTGRKLPSIPTDRPSTAGTTRLSSIPKLSRPSTAGAAPSKGSPVGSSADSSTASTHSKVRSSLGGAKSVSASNLSALPRRASSVNVGSRPRSSSKPRQGTTGANKPASSQNSLVPGKSLSKALSTSSIHNIGNSRKSSGWAKKEKRESKPKAGMMDEAAAKQALAERRKKAREETERLALLDKQRQEEERLKREAEERIRAEEEAKEEARVRELAELLRQQEEERLKQAIVEKEKRDEEEAERLAAEAKQREVERLTREEDEERAREEAERKAVEDEERRKQEEIERQERRRRVEQIMSRTRQTAHCTAASDDSRPTLHVPPNNSQETQNLATGDTKRKVNEILQKVKGLPGSQSNLAQIDQDEEDGDCSIGSSNMVMGAEPDDKDQSGSPDCDSSEESAEQGSACSSESTLGLNGKHSYCVNSDNELNNDVGILRNGNSLVEGQDISGNALSDHHEILSGRVSETQRHNDSESTLSNSSVSVGMDNDGNVTFVSDSVDRGVPVDYKGHLAHNGAYRHGEDEDILWAKAEQTMKAREACVTEALENSGVVAEGDEDEESEEGYMWKVIEGKIEIGEAV